MVFQVDADHTSLFLPSVHPAQSLLSILTSNKNCVGIIKQSVSTIRDGNGNNCNIGNTGIDIWQWLYWHWQWAFQMIMVKQKYNWSFCRVRLILLYFPGLWWKKAGFYAFPNNIRHCLSSCEAKDSSDIGLSSHLRPASAHVRLASPLWLASQYVAHLFSIEASLQEFKAILLSLGAGLFLPTKSETRAHSALL